MKYNLVQEKSFAFALKIIQITKSLKAQHEYIISKQLLKSGMSIGANIEEALLQSEVLIRILSKITKTLNQESQSL